MSEKAKKEWLVWVNMGLQRYAMRAKNKDEISKLRKKRS